MKKVAKVALAIALVLPAAAVNFQVDEIEASTIISGEYAYELNDDGSITIINYGGSEKVLEIPSSIDGLVVSTIGYGAFAESKSIEQLVIPSSVKIIEDNAFSQCSQLMQLTIPNSVVRIGTNAFRGCSSLRSVEIPNSLKELPTGMFFDCTSLESVSIPEGITSIGANVFGNCYSLRDVTLPNTLTTIGDGMFANCVSLESIDIPTGVTVIGTNAFAGCLTLTSISVPNTVKTIGQSAFKDCIALESIVLPDSILGMGYAAFSGCASLKTVNIPAGLTRLTNAVFSGCSSLESIEIPSTITELGDSVFSGCVSLKDITLPNSITEIGKETFQYCSSLENITLPEDLKEIPIGLFRYCDSLKQVHVPNGVTNIEGYAFADCQSLESVSLPNTIVSGGLAVGIFSNSPKVEVSVPAGSVAYNYMANLGNSVKYKVLDSDRINLDKSEMTLNMGDEYTYNALFSNYNLISNTDLTWSSSNPEIVSVDVNGKITALEEGDSVIRAEHANGLVGESNVKVEDIHIPLQSITLSYTEASIQKNQTLALRAMISPNNTTDSKALTWTSSDVNVATVSATGVVSARTPGKVTISARSETGIVATCEVEVTSSIENVSLNLTAIVLDEGAEQNLRASINPIDTTDDKTLTWSSSNESVASVDSEGNVRAISKGYATIAVVATNGKRAECTITVNEKALDIPIISLQLNKTELNLIEGDEEALSASINPSDTTDDKTLTWESSDVNVATVDDSGKVIAIAPGQVTITVTSSNGKTAQCVVNVEMEEIEITSVTLNKETLLLRGTSSEQLIATINPSDTTSDKTLTWTSSDEKVAIVDDSGNVSAVAPGQAIISVTTSNAITDTCTVSVVEQDKSALQVVVDQAQELLDGFYTNVSLEILMTSIDAANTVLEDAQATQEEIDAQEALVEEATQQLVERAEETLLESLSSAVASAKQMAANFTQEEFANMQQAIDAAEIILNKEVLNISKVEAQTALNTIVQETDKLGVIEARNVLTETINSATAILNGNLTGYVQAEIEALQAKVTQAQGYINTMSEDAPAMNVVNDEIKNLMQNLTITKIEKSHLEAFVQASTTLDAATYTTTTWSVYAQKVSQAQTLLNETYYTQVEIDEVYTQLVDAFTSLRVKVNKTSLKLKIDLVNTIVENKELYKPETIVGVDTLLIQANTTYADPNVSEEALSTLNDQLLIAILKARIIE